ncbi:phosphopantetheine-binding protein [Micromonospora sp. NPDC050417]|uniref:phosphopantetheine-binding protein n=1 Tax=Micromonospora sp. NPDC050417 TaxID=3364280 RepID=UPI0037BCD882
MDRTTIAMKIRRQLGVLLPEVAVEHLADEANLRDLASFDSLTVLQLMVWLEGEFDIEIADDELTVERFDAIAKITDFVLLGRDRAGSTVGQP